MKRSLLVALLLVASSLVVDSSAQQVVKKRIGSYLENGNVVVAEANTTLAVDITVEYEQFVVGPYAKHAQRLLGSSAPLVNREVRRIVNSNVAVVDGATYLATEDVEYLANEQSAAFKKFAEDIARIWLEYLIVHSVDGIKMEQEVDTGNGEKQIQVVTVPQTVLEQLQATVKIDITPKSVYDKFAQEQTIENLLMQGFLTAQRIGELEIYAELLDDDSVAPKIKIKEACELVRAEQQKIAMMQAQAQAEQQRAMQFLNEDVEAQASQMADAMGGMPQQMPPEEVPQETEGDM